MEEKEERPFKEKEEKGIQLLIMHMQQMLPKSSIIMITNIIIMKGHQNQPVRE